VLETLRILEGRVSACVNGIVVLRTMVERQVQALKLWACLLCDYTRVRADPGDRGGARGRRGHEVGH
jgi:hypothetical protein